MSEDDGDTQEPGFTAAMAELEAILARVESEETDIDRLAEEMARAARLLEICRTRIRKAEIEVSQIVEGLDDEDGRPDAGGES